MMSESRGHSESIVITGAGIACALGLNKREVWDAVRHGDCGIAPLTQIEQADQCIKGGGQAPDLPQGFCPGLPREVQYLRAVLRDALEESQFLGSAPAPHRCGIVLGTTLAGMRAAGRYFRSGDLEHMRQFTAASVMQRALNDLPIAGFATTTCSACASGLSSVAIALTLLRTNQLDMVIAGGYDPISEYAYAGFNSLRLVADGPLLPFAKKREGMKLGEGYGVLVLERAADAAARKVQALARVAGFGESSDAHHLTQPHPEGDGASRAMFAALADAGINADAIGMISAHATATPNNDAAEFQAYQCVFGARLPQIPMVAFKSHLGHTLGGAGAVELILSILALRHQCVLPTASVQQDAIEFDGLRLLTSAEPRAFDHTMNLSMGFGGANACIVLERATHAGAPQRLRRAEPTHVHEAVVTGIGVVAPGCIGNDAFIDRCNGDVDGAIGCEGGIDDDQISELINARRTRRMSEFAKLVLAATTVALRDAGVDDVEAFSADCGAVLGSTHGAVGFSESYYRQVVEEGVDAANPLLFAEGVPNVASAQLSLMLGIRAGSQTIVGSRTAGLDALRLAVLRIQSGVWDRVIVCAAEEFHPLVNQAYEHCSGEPMRSASGAVALILENRAAAERRGAQPRGIVTSGATIRMSANSGDWLKSATRDVCRILGTADDTVYSGRHAHLAETFSVMPLAALAAMLLTRRAAGALCSVQANATSSSATAASSPSLPRLNVVACDPLGIISGVAVTLVGPA